MKEGIDAVIVDSVLKIRNGLTKSGNLIAPVIAPAKGPVTVTINENAVAAISVADLKTDG